MKKILILLLSSLALFSANINDKNLMKELSLLNKTQKENLLFALKKGKEKNLSLTLAAISWQESSFGLYTSNPKDGISGSYCMFQVQSSTAAKRYNISLMEAKNKLLKDKNFCVSAAIDELEFWKGRKNNSFPMILARYNAGYKGLDNPNGKKYSDEVRAKVKTLMHYIKKNNIKY